MKILLIEDDSYKANAICNFLSEELQIANVVWKESLSSGTFELLDNTGYNLILLDMSMPSYDVSDKDPAGGIPESYAGEDFLAQMTILDIDVPVIVVTQFDKFDEGDDSFSLESLDKRLLEKHSDIYFGAIYFRSTSNEWKTNLKIKIEEVLK